MKNIIKVLLVLMFIPILSSAESVCNKDKYTVVYVNGMLNSEADAEYAREALETYLPTKYNNLDIVVRKVFNPSHIAGAGDLVKVLLQKSLDISKEIAGLDYDAKEMLQTLHNEVKEGRILFVPHSQGNFYANTMHAWIVTQKDGLSHESINMYNVASPTQFGAVNSKYILSKTDKVISGMVGMVGSIAPPNVNFKITKDSKDPLGHNFIDVYLAQGKDKIISDIKSELKLLAPDENKDEYTACIPSPEMGLMHDVEGALYKIADPVAIFVKETVSSALGNVFSSIATVFESNKNTIAKVESEEPVLNESNNQIEDTEIKNWPKLDNTNKVELETKSAEEKLPKEDEVLLNSSKSEIKNEADDKISNPIVLSGISGPSNTVYTPPQIIETGNPSTSTPDFSSSTNPEATSTTLTPPNSSSTDPVIPPNSTSTELTLGVDIIPYGDVRNIPYLFTAADPKISDLMISEYYIGKDEEASWVEIYNRSGDFINTKNVEFLDGENNVKFPVTGMPAYSSIILRSSGKIIHKAPSTLVVANSLQERTRDTGSFSLVYKNENNILILDNAPYGGDYCKSKYSYSRSCERMVDIFPGDKGEYWVRSRIIEDIYHDYESVDPKYWTSIGKENPSWYFSIYEGNVVNTPGLNSNNVRDRRLYVSGYLSVPKDTIKTLKDGEFMFPIRTESGVFENKDDTTIDVYGTLHVPPSGLLRSFEKGDIKIIIRDTGKVIEDIFGAIDVPTEIDGGLMRANIHNSKITLNSGKLYLSYSKFDNRRVVAESCNYYKESYSGSYYGVEWNGGILYKDGYSCGSREEVIPDKYIGEFDLFGVIDRRDPLTCSYHVLSTGEADCNEIIKEPLKTEEKTINNSQALPIIENITTLETKDNYTDKTNTDESPGTNSGVIVDINGSE